MAGRGPRRTAAPRQRDRLSPDGGRAVALAPARRRRGVAVLGGRPTGAVCLDRGRGGDHRSSPRWGRRPWLDGPDGRARWFVASGSAAWGVDAGRLHRDASLRIRRFRARARWLGAPDLDCGAARGAPDAAAPGISRPRAYPRATHTRSAARGTARRRTPPARGRQSRTRRRWPAAPEPRPD